MRLSATPFRSAPGLLLVLIAFLVTSSPVHATSQEQSEEQLKQLAVNIKKVNRWLSRANKEKSGISAELERQQKKIDQLSKDIRYGKARVRVLEGELQALRVKQKANTKALSKHQAYLKQQIRSAYLYGEQPDLKVLLNAENPQTLAMDMHFFSAIKDAEANKIAAVQTALDELKKTKSDIVTKQAKIQNQNKQLDNKRASLKTAKSQKQTALNKLSASIRSEEQKLGKLKADQLRLKNLIKEIETAITDIPLPDDAEPFSKRKGKLQWPAKGRVLHRFGSTLLKGKLRHNGITLSVKEDQEVKAIHSGRVVFSNWIRGFGLLLIIDHGNNYMSLYGNNKSLAKETGDWVRAKETIAFTQETGQDSDSGLYFEIRKQGKPVNPLLWLSK